MDILKDIVLAVGQMAWKKMERNHKLHALMEKVGLKPMVADDFDSIYAHALANYAAEGDYPELVRIFAVDDIKTNFEKENREGKKLHFLEELYGLFQTDEKLKYLEEIFKLPRELEPEVNVFREHLEYSVEVAASPVQLKKYNRINQQLQQLLEENRRKSFSYQAEKYMEDLVEDFQTEFLDNNYYIHLNGEIRTPRNLSPHQRPHGAHKKNGEPCEESYDAKPFHPLDDLINQWLQDEEADLLVILGEYGTGKTTFMRYMAQQLALKRLKRDAEVSIRDERGRLPLFFPLRDFEKDIEPFVVNALNRAGITDINYAGFERRVENDEFILLMDGFDEMTQDIDKDQKARNFDKLRSLIQHTKRSKGKSKMILTVRSEYFLSAAESGEVFRQADQPNYGFAHLKLFDDEQIQAYLHSHTDKPLFYWKQIKQIIDLHGLAKRPVLLDLIVTYLPRLIEEMGERVKTDNIKASDLYRKCIDEELRRKSSQLEFIIPNRYRLGLLRKLALWMFLNDTLSFDTTLLDGEMDLRGYFDVRQEWQFEKYLNEFLTFSFLIRDGENRFRISHKSFRDYLTATALVEEVNTVKAEELKFFGQRLLTEEIEDFIREQEVDKERLLHLALTARDLPEERQWQGSNALRVLLPMDEGILKGRDLSGCRLASVDFFHADLTDTDLRGADLSLCYFDKSLLAARFQGADFTNSAINLRFHKGLKDISFAVELKGVVRLYLHGQQVVDASPLQGLSSLKELYLNGNQVVDVSPLQSLSNLRSLALSGTLVTDLSPLQDLDNIYALGLSKTQVVDVSPLQGLTNLKRLYLNGSQVVDVSPLQGLNDLSILDLRSTQVVDVSPLLNLKHLELLVLSKNQIPQEQIKDLKKAIPGVAVREV